MNQSDTSALRRANLMDMVADGLTARGFRISYPEHEDGRCLTFVGLNGVRSEVAVSDDGRVEWECSGWTAGKPDPHAIADLVATLLAGRSVDCPRGDDQELLVEAPFKGIVGRQLKASGLDVCLHVYEDENIYDVQTEIAVTSPGVFDGTTVRVTDDGAVQWERDFCPEDAAITCHDMAALTPGTAGDIARSIVDAVALALSRLIHI